MPVREGTVVPAAELDAVVVGGGPAGLASAVWLARYRRSVVVVDSQDYRSAAVERSHGYLGRDPQTPVELLDVGRRELLEYPTARVLPASVTSIGRRPDGLFEVSTPARTLLAHRVVLATGVRDVRPAVEGFDEHYGASVFHCPACDGYEGRDRDVLVIGWAAHLAGFAVTLLNWARSVTVVTDGQPFADDEGSRSLLAGHGIEVVQQRAARFLGTRGALEGLLLADGRRLPVSLAFFSLAHLPQTGLARPLGCAVDPEGYLVVDQHGQTSTSGVYAAGDVTPGLQLVQVAAASGVVAGVGAAHSFLGARSAPTSPPPGPNPTAPQPAA